MKISHQVCSLELAKRLKKLNCKQESLWWWTNCEIDVDGKYRFKKWNIVLEKETFALKEYSYTDDKDLELYSAYTSAELPFVLKWCSKCLSFNIRRKDIQNSEYERCICNDCGNDFRSTKLQFLVNPLTKCWEWRGSLTGCGYGHFQQKGKLMDAHKAYYEAIIGKVPQGKELDHLCKNPKCVNPWHLEPVSHAINNRRGKKAKLSKEVVEKIKQLKGEYTEREIGKMFQVSHATVGDIFRGRTWN